MTKPLPFTELALRRAIAAAQKAGLYVVGIQPDGTVLTSTVDKPLDGRVVGPQDADARRWGDDE